MSKHDSAVGPSIEFSPDIQFLDIDLSEFAYDKPLDLGPHGTIDPQEPNGVFDNGRSFAARQTFEERIATLEDLLSATLTFADWTPADHPRDDNGRFRAKIAGAAMDVILKHLGGPAATRRIKSALEHKKTTVKESTAPKSGQKVTKKTHELYVSKQGASEMIDAIEKLLEQKKHKGEANPAASKFGLERALNELKKAKAAAEYHESKQSDADLEQAAKDLGVTLPKGPLVQKGDKIVTVPTPEPVKPHEETAKPKAAEKQWTPKGLSQKLHSLAAGKSAHLPNDNWVEVRDSSMPYRVHFKDGTTADVAGSYVAAQWALEHDTTPLDEYGLKTKGGPQTPAPGSLTYVKGLGGSTGAKLYKDAAGQWYTVKHGNSPAHIREEDLANRLYRTLGVSVPESQLHETPEGPTQVAKFVEGMPLSKLDDTAAAQAEAILREHFVADALLGNWDVIGLERDNIIVTPDGTPVRIDNGGSLRFRAQGGKKSLTADLPELQSMRFKGEAGKVFGTVTDAAIANQASDIVAHREQLLAATPPDLRAVMAKRLDVLEGLVKAAHPSAEPKSGDPITSLDQLNSLPVGSKLKSPSGLATWTKLPDGKWGYENGVGSTDAAGFPLDGTYTIGELPGSEPAGLPGGFQKGDNAYVGDSKIEVLGTSSADPNMLTIQHTDNGSMQNVYPSDLQAHPKTPIVPAPEGPNLKVGDLVKSPADMDALPVGTEVLQPGGGNGYVKLADGNWKNTNGAGVSYPPTQFGFGVGWEITSIPQSDEVKTTPNGESSMKVGNAITAVAQLDALPTGSEIKSDGSLAWKKKPDGDWEYQDASKHTLGSTGFPTASGDYKITKIGNEPSVQPGPVWDQKNEPTPPAGTLFQTHDGKTVFKSKGITNGVLNATVLKSSGGNPKVGDEAGWPEADAIKFGDSTKDFWEPAGPAGPQVGDKITTVEQLDALPTGSKILSSSSPSTLPLVKQADDTWKAEGGEKTIYKSDLALNGNLSVVSVGSTSADSTDGGDILPALVPGATVVIQKGDTVTEAVVKSVSGKYVVLKAQKYEPGKPYLGSGSLAYLATDSQYQWRIASVSKAKAPQKGDHVLVDVGDGNLVNTEVIQNQPSKGKALVTINGKKTALPHAQFKNNFGPDPTVAVNFDPGDAAKAAEEAMAKQKAAQEAEAKIPKNGDAINSAEQLNALPVGAQIKASTPAEPQPNGWTKQPGGTWKYDTSQTGKEYKAEDLKLEYGFKVTLAKPFTAQVAGGVGAAPPGPPTEFNAIPSWAAAKQYIPDANNAGLTAEEKAAITSYTGSGYSSINAAIRNSAAVMEVGVAKKAAAIKKALRKGIVQHDIWIGRKTTLDTWKTNAQPGKVIQDNGVMSSSTSPGSWSGDVFLNVLIRAGSNALHVKSISSHSGEDEVLMPPGSMFHVIKREQKGNMILLYVEMIT